MTTRDSHDTKREQYISHKLYLQRRTANRYYNLGYMMYKSVMTIVVNSGGQNTYPNANAVNIQEAIKNFDIALLFNPNDVDAKARKDDLCDKWGPNSTSKTIMQLTINQTHLDAARNDAKKIHRNCTC